MNVLLLVAVLSADPREALAKAVIKMEADTQSSVGYAQAEIYRLYAGKIQQSNGSGKPWWDECGKYIFLTGGGYDAEKTKADLIEKQQKKIDELQKTLTTLKNGGVILPDLRITAFFPGQVGRLRGIEDAKQASNQKKGDPYQVPFTVSEVVSDNEMIVNFGYFGKKDKVFITGLPTAGIEASQKTIVEGVFLLGTKQVSGADMLCLEKIEVNEEALKKAVAALRK